VNLPRVHSRSDMKACIAIIADAERHSEAAVVQALEHLQYDCERMDSANDLHTLHGLVPLMKLLSCPSSAIRRHAYWVLATCLQHNPTFQKQVSDEHLEGGLLDMIAAQGVPEVQQKQILAQSALLRHNDEALARFVSRDGFQVAATS